jgi:hypothetical protein
VSHQLQQVTDRKKIRGFERSIAWDKESPFKLIELWQCAACRVYWEYVREIASDGVVEHERWSLESLVGRQEGGCL